jgi:hypothetical protein
LEGIFKQDDQQHTQWVTQFGKEYQLLPLQQTALFAAYILSFSSILIAIFMVMLMYKALQIGEMQAKIRLNDFYQVITCIVIPSISS